NDYIMGASAVMYGDSWVCCYSFYPPGADDYYGTIVVVEIAANGTIGSVDVQYQWGTVGTSTDAIAILHISGDIFAVIHRGEGQDGYVSTINTASVAPTVTTDPATAVAATTATLKGTLEDDGGEACDVRFQYGETIAYGTDTEWQSGKESVVAFEQAITGLDPNKTYHFRAQARNSAGTVNGADRTFTTLVAAPSVTTNPATGRGTIAATVNGTLNQDGGEACECGFEWGLDTGYGTVTPIESKTTGEAFSQ
ncbi:unnamed protein product, partial [marine sediment metagenome]